MWDLELGDLFRINGDTFFLYGYENKKLMGIKGKIPCIQARDVKTNKISLFTGLHNFECELLEGKADRIKSNMNEELIEEKYL